MSFNIFKNFSVRMKYINKRIIFSFIGLLLLVIMVSIGVILNAPKDLKVGPLDVLTHGKGMIGLTGSYIQATVIIPIYSFLVMSIIDCDNNPMFITRRKSRGRSWYFQMRDSIIVSFGITFLVVVFGYLISGIFLGDFNNYFSSLEGINYRAYWDDPRWEEAVKIFETTKVLAIVFTSLFMGLNFLGVFIGTLKCFIDNKYIWILIISLALYEAMAGKISFVIGYTVMNFDKWANPSALVSGLIYMLLATIVFYIAGSYFINKKDLINK